MPTVLEVVQTAGNVVEYRMKVEVTKEQIATEVEHKLKELARTTKIKGFRQGKVPLRIIDQRFGQWVRQEVAGRLIEQSFRDSLQQQNLQPLGPPAIQVEDNTIHFDQGIFYTAIFTAIAPEGQPLPAVNVSSEPSLKIDEIPLFTAPSDQTSSQAFENSAALPTLEIDGLVLDQPLAGNSVNPIRPSAERLNLDDPLKDIPFFTAPVSTAEESFQFDASQQPKTFTFSLSEPGNDPPTINLEAPTAEPPFTLFPENNPLVVDQLMVEKWVAEVTDEDVESMLQRLRQLRQTWQNVDTVAQRGDKVTVDLSGTINGEPFKNSEIRQLSLILGENSLGIPPFDDSLIGLSAGEQKTVTVTVPPEHYNAEFAGKNIEFIVKIHAVARPQLLALDAEFAKTLGVADGDLTTLRRETCDNMDAQLQEVINYRLRRQVLNALLKANPIVAPLPLLEQEKTYLLQQALQNNPHRQTELTAEMFTQEAEQRVRLGLLVVQLAKNYQIQVGAEEMRQQVEKIALAYENSDDIINQYYADPKRLGEVYSSLLEEHVANWLLARARIVEKKTDFYTVMNLQVG